MDEPGHYDYCRPLKSFTPIKLYRVSHFLLGFAGKALEAIFEYSPREAEQNKWIEWQIGWLRINRNHQEQISQVPVSVKRSGCISSGSSWHLAAVIRPPAHAHHDLFMYLSCSKLLHYAWHQTDGNCRTVLAREKFRNFKWICFNIWVIPSSSSFYCNSDILLSLFTMNDNRSNL